jgi:hypothetical protein
MGGSGMRGSSSNPSISADPFNLETSPTGFNAARGVAQRAGGPGVPFGATPSLFGDANWSGTMNTNGSYTPGKFDTLASYGGIAKDGFNLWNQFQAGKIARENLDLNKQSLAFQKNVTGAKFEEAARGRTAQLLANSGNYNGMAAYDAAGPVAKARRTELGLA